MILKKFPSSVVSKQAWFLITSGTVYAEKFEIAHIQTDRFLLRATGFAAAVM